jgi:hypothetical protein
MHATIRYTHILITLLFLACPLPAQAITINFQDGVAIRDCEVFNPWQTPDMSEYQEDGMRVLRGAYDLCDSWANVGPPYGYAGYHNSDIESLRFSLIDGGLFDLISVDFSYYREVDTGHPDTLSFGGGLSFTLLPGPGTPSSMGFAPFVFPEGWTGINAFEVTIATNCCSWFELDNLEFRPVPEPSTVLLLALAIGGFALRHRKPPA